MERADEKRIWRQSHDSWKITKKLRKGVQRRKINFTRGQYKHLTDLLYLGGHTANYHRTEDDRNEDYAAPVQYIYAFAENFGAHDSMAYGPEMDIYSPTFSSEDSVELLIRESEDGWFWQELSELLALRDIQTQRIRPRIEKNYMRKMYELEEQYKQEFKQHGVGRLVVRKSNFQLAYLK